MNPFVRFLYNNPFFAVCFIIHSIPFWVPLAAILYGADPVLMVSISALTILTRAYVQSEIMASNPFDMMFRYFLASPILAVLRFLFTLALIGVFITYAVQGEAVDKWIAAIMTVFVIKIIYFRPRKALYWNVSGLKVYWFYNLAGRLLTALLWISLMSVPFDAVTSLAVGFLAVFVSCYTFYKTNEGLL